MQHSDDFVVIDIWILMATNISNIYFYNKETNIILELLCNIQLNMLVLMMLNNLIKFDIYSQNGLCI